MNIGVFDSGIGGLTVMEEIVRLLPNYDYIFYGDQKNNPYGEKTDEELLNITSSIVDYLISRDCHIIVIACNTATTRCMKKLRVKYPDIVFIGTVPAVKVACDNDSRNTLVLATPATIHSERVQELILDNKKETQNIYLAPCYGLANAIEFNENDKIDMILLDLHDTYIDKNIDCIVLGCTHYPYIKDSIQSLFPDAVLVDGNNGVAREVRHQLQLMDRYEESDTVGTVEIIFDRK
ncbi:MAG: glutamate racemase [Erysipelotrichaceae bacterium]|nr:glutamate racemase [Erysipelotrichaceae bacterium]